MVHRSRTLLVAILLLCSTAARAVPSPPDGGVPPADARARFEAALDLAGKDDARAAAAMEALAEADPTGEYADDALVEAAELLEDKLGRPDRARDLYARLLARAPHSRLALRARARLDFLDANLKTGAEPLAEYQRILYGFAARPPLESAARMAALVEAHPDFALADKALLWLAGTLAREGRREEAERRYLEVESRFPGGESWALGRKGRAELRLLGGHPFEARALYRSILESKAAEAPGPAQDAARAGLDAAEAAIRRLAGLALALAYLAGVVVVLLVSARPLRWPRPMPAELVFYAPVAGLFVLCGATENRSILIATLLLATGGGVLLAASSLSTMRRLARGPLGPAAGIARALAIALAAAALLYAAVYMAGITDLVVETLRSGPDR